MTFKEYEKRISELKEKGARGKALDFNGQKPIEFLKMEIFEILITDAAFHWADKWVPPKNGGSWTKETEIVDWKKNYILMLGGLCGIESEPSKSEKTGKYSYLSQANIFRMTPSGHKIYESAEYEFDSEVRAEEVVLKNEIKFMEYEEKVASGQKPNREVKRKYTSDAKKRLAVVEMAKNARSRADTGAHKRAIIKMLKLPYPDANLMGSYLFCFQCVPDFTNSMIRNQYLLGNNDGGGVFGETSRPVLKDATVIVDEEPTIKFKIGEQRAALKDHKALCKITGMVLNRGQNLEEYYQFMIDYSNMSKEQKVDEVVKRLTDFVEVPNNVISGDPSIKLSFVTEWGNN